MEIRRIRPVEKDQLIHFSLGLALYGLAESINHNLSHDAVEDRWLQRVAWTTRIRSEDLSRFRRISRDRAEDFVTSVDDLFSAYETIYPDERADSDCVPVGVGVFYFESDVGKTSFFEKSQER